MCVWDWLEGDCLGGLVWIDGNLLVSSRDVSFPCPAVYAERMGQHFSPDDMTASDLQRQHMLAAVPSIPDQRSSEALYRVGDVCGAGVSVLPNVVVSGPDAERLVYLDASWNLMSVLPPELWGLSRLVALNLRYNAIDALPPRLCSSLPLLESLDVSHNTLGALPDDIGALAALHTLDARDNALTSVPPALAGLTALAVLRLDGNPRLTNLVPVTYLCVSLRV